MSTTPARPVNQQSPARLFATLAPFLKPYKSRVALALAFLLLAAGTTLVIPVLLKRLIDYGFTPALINKDTSVLGPALIALAIAGLVMAIAAGARFMVVSWLGERVVSDIRRAVYARLLTQPPVFFETLKTGEVLSRLTTDTTLIQTLVGSSLSMGLRNGILLMGSIGMLFYTFPKITAGVLGGIAVVSAVVFLFSRRIRKLSRASQDRVADVSSLAGEVLGAMTTVQANTQEQKEASRFNLRVEDAFKTGMRRTQVRAVLIVFVMSAFVFGMLYGVWMGGKAVIAGETTVGTLSQFFFYAMMVGGAVSVIAEVWGDVQRAAGASERLVELLEARPAIADPATPQSAPSSQGGLTVAFENVSFTYPSRPERPVLHGVSFTAQPGERVALVGPSGAGKSTVFALLQRFYEPQSGSIVLNGTSVAALKMDDLRAQFSVVPQDPVIFSDNALENIRYGRPDATQAQVIEAAKAAHAHDFISALPQGYQTDLGERGVRLSGGQKQRIAIARAILRNAPVLLLDEATSALDAESEVAVQAALANAMAGRTTLVIAHRLATVRDAHRILVFEAAQIVEQGTHTVLIARNGLYARLVNLQSLA
jgi:ATP-binding cassette, subfamily B, bacterial